MIVNMIEATRAQALWIVVLAAVLRLSLQIDTKNIEFKKIMNDLTMRMQCQNTSEYFGNEQVDSGFDYGNRLQMYTNAITPCPNVAERSCCSDANFETVKREYFQLTSESQL